MPDSRARMDNSAFPIRIKVMMREPWTAELYRRIEDWLIQHAKPGGYAHHCAKTMGQKSAAYFFRRMDVAARFLEAFPELTLADGTRAPGYHPPQFVLSGGREEMVAIPRLDYDATKLDG